MRIAVVSDIHANLTALNAVVADLRQTSPDLVVMGGDLMNGGPRPAEVIDRVREMNWAGVYGNTDEISGRHTWSLRHCGHLTSTASEISF